ncbi:MAG: pyruvate kinase [Deltaproteobacteria bacterium]|nr:pyruvate kinase [Deltaproteobacteria bacterium]
MTAYNAPRQDAPRQDAPRRAEPKTKIVCTIGPATASEERLRELLKAGVDVIRLNFSHGTQADHQLVIERVRWLATQLKLPIAILQDLAGPKVRIGTFTTDSITLQPGAPFTLTTRAIVGTAEVVSVSYPQLPQEVKPGDPLLLADGAVTLVVEHVTAEDITCRVTAGGTLSAHKGVNCPSGLLSLPILSEKDLHDVQFGIEHEVDYIGLSFVRTAEDVRIAKAEIANRGAAIPVIAKIETQAALAHIDEILEAADGIMVARGDLGIETPLPRIPLVQKQLIAKANRLAKPVITATQMLWSMVDNPRPSRAEATDVANAIIDGTDALMLSEETTIGRYPVEAVRMMTAIAIETEHADLRVDSRNGDQRALRLTEAEAVAHAACEIAAAMDMEAIVTVTLEGTTARLVAKYRPAQPILAVTSRLDTYRRLALVRGVTPVLLPAEIATRGAMIEKTKAVMRDYNLRGKKIVIMSSISAEQNLLATEVL